MKLIVGLGNPGKKYEHTRHNVGYMMIEQLRVSIGSEPWKESSHESRLSEGVIGWEKVTLMKPETFMNLSGKAVASFVHFYKLDPKRDILIISDDIDMTFAKVRYRDAWSHGGQNGLRDIIEKLGTDEYSRIKIGIGRHESYAVSDWVLSKFTKEEQEVLESEVYPKVEGYINTWLWDSIS